MVPWYIRVGSDDFPRDARIGAERLKVPFFVRVGVMLGLELSPLKIQALSGRSLMQLIGQNKTAVRLPTCKN